MRYSRGRLLLRVVLLLLGGGFMEWRALETWRAGRQGTGGGQVLGERMALVMALVGLLAILTALAALLQLRTRERRRSLHLPVGPAPTDGRPGPGSPPSGGP